jgi:hypothetical protein
MFEAAIKFYLATALLMLSLPAPKTLAGPADQTRETYSQEFVQFHTAGETRICPKGSARDLRKIASLLAFGVTFDLQGDPAATGCADMILTDHSPNDAHFQSTHRNNLMALHQNGRLRLCVSDDDKGQGFQRRQNLIRKIGYVARAISLEENFTTDLEENLTELPADEGNSRSVLCAAIRLKSFDGKKNSVAFEKYLATALNPRAVSEVSEPRVLPLRETRNP